MSHDTHHDVAHHDAHHAPTEERPKVAFSSAFWFVVILAGLFIAAVNFTSVMSHDAEAGHGGGHGEHATEQHSAGHPPTEHTTTGPHSAPASGAHAPAAEHAEAGHGEEKKEEAHH